MERAGSQAWYADMKDEHLLLLLVFQLEDGPFRAFALSKQMARGLFVEREIRDHPPTEVTNRALFDQITSPLAQKKGGFVVLDNQGRVLANEMDARGVSEGGGDVAQYPYLSKVYEAKQGWYSTKINGLQSLVVYETNRLDWKVVTIVSQEELWQQLQLVKKAAIAVSILFVVLTVTVLAGFGLRTTKRLNFLVRSMRRVRSGDMGLTIKVHSKDELADLEEESTPC